MQTTGDLVDLARRGDETATGVLIKRYEQTVIVTAWNILDDYHLAQDIAQESFVEAFRKLDQLRRDEAFGPWLLATTRRKALRAKRQRPSEVIGAELSNVDEASSNRLSDFEDLLGMLQQLPEHERDVVCLRYISGLSVRQIADDTQRPIGTVTKQLTRAINRLKTLIVKVQP